MMYQPTLIIPIHPSLKSCQNTPPRHNQPQPANSSSPTLWTDSPFPPESIPEQRRHRLLPPPLLRLHQPLLARSTDSMLPATPGGDLHEISVVWSARCPERPCPLPAFTHVSVAGSTPFNCFFNINQLTLIMSSLLAKHARMWHSSKYVNIFGPSNGTVSTNSQRVLLYLHTNVSYGLNHMKIHQAHIFHFLSMTFLTCSALSAWSILLIMPRLDLFAQNSLRRNIPIVEYFGLVVLKYARGELMAFLRRSVSKPSLYLTVASSQNRLPHIRATCLPSGSDLHG